MIPPESSYKGYERETISRGEPLRTVQSEIPAGFEHLDQRLSQLNTMLESLEGRLQTVLAENPDHPGSPVPTKVFNTDIGRILGEFNERVERMVNRIEGLVHRIEL